MAEETTLIGNTLTFDLKLAGFCVEFNVDLDASVACTRQHKIPAIDGFLFVVASIWIKVGEKRYAVISPDEVWNLDESLKTLEAAVKDPVVIDDIEKIIDRGALSTWMRSYWEKIYAERATEEDEAIYDKLDPACKEKDKYGCIAIYRYVGLPTIEVASKSSLKEKPVVMSCVFEITSLSNDIAELRKQIRSAIQRRMSAH